jgi:hypothetical protein
MLRNGLEPLSRPGAHNATESNNVTTGSKTISLLLHGKELRSLPLLRGLEHIQFLNFSKNNLRQIPTSISVCLQLTQLDLSNNYISFLNTALLPLEKLLKLDLSRNKLTSILSEDCNSFEGLEDLNLSYNQIETISERLSTASKLKVLSLHCNPLLQIPKQIVSMASLKELSLGWNLNQVSSPTASLEQLRELILLPVHPFSQSIHIKQYLDYYSAQSLSSFEVSLESAIKNRQEALALALVSSDKLARGGSKQSLAISRVLSPRSPGAFDLGELGDELQFEYSTSLLSLALKSGLEVLSMKLIEKGCPIHLRMNENGESPLHYAVHLLSEKLVRSLLSTSKRKELVACRDDNGNTPLHILALKRDERYYYCISGYSQSPIVLQGRPNGPSPRSQNSPPIKIKMYSPQDQNLGILGNVNELKKPVTMLDFRSRQEFADELVAIWNLLVEAGIDPNCFNGLGFCAWQVPILRNDYILFRVMKEKAKMIDWQIGLQHSTLPILHVLAVMNDSRIFIDMVNSLAALQFDNNLMLPFDGYDSKRSSIPGKIFLKALKKDFCKYLKISKVNHHPNESNIHKKISLLKKTSSRSHNISNSTSPRSAKRIPISQVSEGLARFHRNESAGNSRESRMQINRVYCLDAKPSYRKPSIHNSIDRGNTVITESSQNASHANSYMQEPTLKEQDSHHSAWVNNVISNMIVTNRNIKHRPMVKKINYLDMYSSRPKILKSNESSPGISLNMDTSVPNLHAKVQVEPFNVHEVSKEPSARKVEKLIYHGAITCPNHTQLHGPSLQPSRKLAFPKKPVPDSANTDGPESVQENVFINLSNKNFFYRQMSRINACNSKPFTKPQDPTIDKLTKMTIRLLLKDIISFRYNARQLQKFDPSTASSAQPSQVPVLSFTLYRIHDFLCKLLIVARRIGCLMSQEVFERFVESLAREIQFDGSLGKVYAWVSEVSITHRRTWLVSKQYSSLELVERILLSLERVASKQLLQEKKQPVQLELIQKQPPREQGSYLRLMKRLDKSRIISGESPEPKPFMQPVFGVGVRVDKQQLQTLAMRLNQRNPNIQKSN